MTTVSFRSTNDPAITIAASLELPPGFDPERTYPAIVATHPSGGVKEQTAGLYARRLAAEGFVAIAADASYQGESTGEPRQLENPAVRVEDVSAVIDHLATLPYVDADRIGAFGICAGGGYTVGAAMNDRRIRAVGLVSPVNLGAVFRNGHFDDADAADALPLLDESTAARATDAAGGEPRTFPLVQMTEADAPNEEIRQVWEYYFASPDAHPNAVGWAPARSLSQVVTYDAFHLADVYLTQPLLVVVGGEAGTRWMGDELYAKAASADKHRHVVDGALHMELYGREDHVSEAVSVLAPFYARTLAPAST